MITFTIEPVGKPRIVRSDTWNPRAQVAKYYLFKDELNLQAKIKRYVLSDSLSIVFHIPMPASWSLKKKLTMAGQPCKSKPDIDNLVKAFTDALTTDDAHIYEIHAVKKWSERGLIEVQ